MTVDPNGDLWVTDNGNNRILRYLKSSLTDGVGKTAVEVIGQSGFTTDTADDPPTASSLNSPYTAAMGDAYTAVDGDVFGSYYNPATSARTNTAGLMFQRGYAEDSTGMP